MHLASDSGLSSSQSQTPFPQPPSLPSTPGTHTFMEPPQCHVHINTGQWYLIRWSLRLVLMTPRHHALSVGSLWKQKGLPAVISNFRTVFRVRDLSTAFGFLFSSHDLPPYSLCFWKPQPCSSGLMRPEDGTCRLKWCFCQHHRPCLFLTSWFSSLLSRWILSSLPLSPLPNPTPFFLCRSNPICSSQPAPTSQPTPTEPILLTSQAESSRIQ